MNMISVIWILGGIVLLGIIAIALLVMVIVFAVKSSKKHNSTNEIQLEQTEMKRTLGEKIKDHRVCCNMTQEYVAETVGVSRQAVSKWETGTSEPSTTNLLALAKLFNISVEELLRGIE